MLFRDNYDFLSNMYPCIVPISLNNKLYKFKCAESAFQAFKNLDFIDHFVELDGYRARRFGRTVKIKNIKLWESIKDRVMYKVVKAKFDNNPNLINRLLDIDGQIQEDNYWHDTYWGVCNGKGLNKLGSILMHLRKVYCRDLLVRLHLYI